ncbi:MFS transporter [Actinokineospora inagensis]|uniref:MFS transporter n=1 Tax=Actinokineospora inagensis TaxID=103730 RepID=UPI001B7F8F79|nr:MFS transporter [Actinokineospora inagensis]
MTKTGLALAVLLSSLGTSVANVALPTLSHQLGATFQAVQWVVLAYLLAGTVLLVSVGRLGDIIGRGRLLRAGTALFTVASVVCAVAPSLSVLVVARVGQGLGAAVMLALSMALIGSTVPREKTGSAMGLLGTMSAVGTAGGPTLGGLTIAVVGWRGIFVVTAVLGVVVLLLIRALSSSERTPTRFDSLGTVLLAITLTAYALAMTVGHTVLLLVAAVVAAGVFVVVESRTTAPLVRLSALHDPALAMSFLVSTVVMSTLVVGPFYLSRSLNLEPAAVGLAMSAGPVVSALTGIPAGRVVDRIGAATMTVVGLTAMVVGCLALALMPKTLLGYLVPLVVTTCGYAQFQAANNTTVMAGVSADQRGVVSGMLNLSRNLGLITGTSVMGAVFALGASTHDVTTASGDAVATGMHVTFAVAAALIVVAVGIAVVKQVAQAKQALKRPA